MQKLFTLILFFTTFILKAQSYNEQLLIHRENYLKDLTEHGPLKADDIKYVFFFQSDSSYRVKCDFKASKRATKPFEIPTSAGTTKTYTKFGELHFTLNNKPYRLAVYRSISLMKNPLYKDYLFVPFKDLTNGKETYGGGRYLDLRMGEIGEKSIWLDFNKAYNPYCAFSEGYSCPIPPKENHLNTRIEAGEKCYQKKN